MFSRMGGGFSLLGVCGTHWGTPQQTWYVSRKSYNKTSLVLLSRQQIALLMFFLLACVLTLTGWQRAVFYGQNVATSVVTGTPTFIQSRSASSTTTNSTGSTVNSCATSTYCYMLGEGSLSGNTIVGAVQYSDTGTPTVTVTDDASNTYSVIATASDTTNHIRVAMFRAINVNSGARQVRVNFSTNVSHVSAAVTEFNQVATSSADDGSATGVSASGSSTMATTTNLVPGQTNDLIVQCGARSQTPKGTATVGSQGSITWAFATTDSIDGLFCQWGQYASTSSFNPQMTMSGASGFATVAIALKTANTGTPRPAGPRILRVCEVNEPTGTSGASSAAWQCPTDNATAIAVSNGWGGTNYTPTGLVDTQSNTYTRITMADGSTNQFGDGSSGKASGFYVCGPTGSNSAVLTVSSSGTASDYTTYVYVMQGTATSSCLVSAYGNLRSTLTTSNLPFIPFWGYQIPPGVDSGISIGSVQQGFNTSQSITGPCTTFDATLFGGQTISGGGTHPPSENNGWWHCTFSNGNTARYSIGQADATTTSLSTAAAFLMVFKGSSANPAPFVDTDFAVPNVNPLKNGTATTFGWFQQDTKSGFKVVSNVAVPNSLSSDDGVVWGNNASNTTAAITNQYGICVLGTLTGTAADTGIGIFLRASNSADTGYRILVNSNSGNNIFVDKFVAGTGTAPISGGTGNSGFVWGTGAHTQFYAQIVGNTIIVRETAGGSNLLSVTDTATGGGPIASGLSGMGYSGTITAAGCTRLTAGAL